MKICASLFCLWVLCSSSFAADTLDCLSADCLPGPATNGCDDLSCFDDAFNFGDLFSGLLQPSDQNFDDFISPMTNPLFFEDPRTLTEARFIFLNQSVPNALFGGDVQLYALQIRAAITENLSLIATKDGFIVSDNALIDDGWADVAAGLKYNLFKDVEAQQILSVGMTYDIPMGSTRALQGNGDGEFHLFASGGTQLGENWHFVTGSGFRLPVDTDAESQVWYWSNHLDYQISDTGFYLLGETSWFHWMKSGSTFPVPVEGTDLFNLGSIGVAGNSIVTGALGLKYKHSRSSEIGVAWEIPLSDRNDLLQNRFTFDWIIRY